MAEATIFWMVGMEEIFSCFPEILAMISSSIVLMQSYALMLLFRLLKSSFATSLVIWLCLYRVLMPD
ncbi:hypothetical protein ACZ75_17815 [Massilia sp. NR 4-1]|nr:hypothetical protein ACZ75_17815 [Massilia sp. NR 4-1]